MIQESFIHIIYVLLFYFFYFLGTANKKAKLINGFTQNPSAGKTTSASSVDEQYYSQQHQNHQTRSGSGPNLVNKQLVLPFVPPSFPNGSANGSNHLIKPSEYLKSISDKKSNAGSTRLVCNSVQSDSYTKI